MKWTITLYCILCLFITSFAQDAGDVSISIHAEHSNYFGYQTNGIGIHGEYFWWDNVAANYHATLGWTSELDFHVNTTMGMAAGGYLLRDEDLVVSDWVVAAAFVAFIIPKGVSFYIPFEEDRLYLVPFVNPLGFDYFGQDEYGDNRIAFSGDAGIKAAVKLTDNISILPYVGGKWLYTNGDKGIFGGLHFQWWITD